jgi:hypothetical protein
MPSDQARKDSTIAVRYCYTLDDALLAHILYLRGNPPRGFYILMAFVSVFVLSCGAIPFLRDEPEGLRLFLVAVGAVVYTWLIHPLLQRHREKCNWHKNVDHAARVVILWEEGIKQVQGGFRGEVKWRQVAKVIESPAGLLFRVGQVYHLLPRRGFESQEDFERASKLLRARCRRFRKLGS